MAKQTQNTMESRDSVSILVHNLSHSDLLLCVELGQSKEELIARPRASRFSKICLRLIRVINKANKFKSVTYKNKYNNDNFIGFEFVSRHKIGTLGEIRLRDLDSAPLQEAKSDEYVYVTKVFFPLISVILPKWIALHKTSKNQNDSNTSTVAISNNDDTIDDLHTCFIMMPANVSNNNNKFKVDYYKSKSKSKNFNTDISIRSPALNETREETPHATLRNGIEMGINSTNTTAKTNTNTKTRNSMSTSIVSASMEDGYASDGFDDSDNNSTIDGNNRREARSSIDLSLLASQASQASNGESTDDEKYASNKETRLPLTRQFSKRPSINYCTIVDSSLKLFLLSGAGELKDIDNDNDNSITNESTQLLALLMQSFIDEFYQNDILVCHFYSKNDSHHYSRNVKFLNEILRPAIDEERSKVALKFGKDWNNHFKVIITLCDGEPARMSSIISGLNTFEPSMLHLWRTKTFWKQYPNALKNKKLDNDIEYLKFNELETYPSMAVNTLNNPLLIQLVNEMKEWKLEFDNAYSNKNNELTKFWLRKSFQLVLVIVIVQKNGHPRPKFFRGCNMEVSMPTGSLCAERNAIGSALANDLTIRREEFKMVAVYGISNLDDKNGQIKDVNPIGPCGSCQEWLGKIAGVNPGLKIVTFSDIDMNEIYVRSMK